MKTLTLLQMNDLHGYLAVHAEFFDLGRESPLRSGGGVARIATRFRRDQARGRRCRDRAGQRGHVSRHDGRGPDPRPGHAGAVARFGSGRHDRPREFAYGLGRLRELADGLAYPILAANCHARGLPLKVQPFTLIDRAGLKVGVIGLAAVLAPHLLHPDERPALELTIGDTELRRLIPSLRRDHAADLIVVLSHLGFPQDYKLATAVPGIDIILSGHTHNRLTSPIVVGDTLIMQSGAHGSFVGRLDLDVAADGIVGWTHALLPVDDDVDVDGPAQALVDEALAPFAAARENVVGDTSCTLHRYAMLESTMDNLLLDATAAAAGTTVALSNGWRYGAPIPAGPLTEWDLWNIVPANPEVSVMTLTGRQLRELFEQNLEATFACDPWQQRGGYIKRCRGIEIVAKLENPIGHRVQQLTAGGASLSDEQTVDAAFLGEQAVPAGTGSGRRALGIRVVQALELYVSRQKTVTPAVRGNIAVM